MKASVSTFVTVCALASCALFASTSSLEVTYKGSHLLNSDEYFLENPWTTEGTEVTGIKCRATTSSGQVVKTNDGTNERCFVVITPENVDGNVSLPVVLFAHGAGGSAYNFPPPADLEGNTWVDIANKHGFALVGLESLQYSSIDEVTGEAQGPHGGQWSIPEVFNDLTGNKCDAADSVDNAYIANVVDWLDAHASFNASRLFFTGCSMGSAFTVWQGQCQHSKKPSAVSAFASHSTGLKIKGDGNRFPPDNYNPQYTWGECPTCKYWPAKVMKTTGLKACIFDNTADPNAYQPGFYDSSKQLDQHWTSLGMRAETGFGSGGHCVIHSNEAIAKCMDDNSGRLFMR